LHTCVKENKPVYGHTKRITIENDGIYYRLVAWPLTNAEGQAKFFVVAFEVPDIAGLLPMLSPGKKLSAKNTRVIELENELAQTKEQLQAFIDQLEAANSQQQLLNEELHSTNEELQVANEELEANNEEQQEANTQIAEAYSKLQEMHRILEQKETALRLTSNTFQTVLDNAREGYVLIGKNYTLAAFNHEADNFFVKLNKTPLVTGESMFRFLPLDFITVFKERFDSAWAGETNSYQIKHVIDGDTFWINARYSPVYGVGNMVESVLLSFDDITTTVIAQQKIDASELLFRSMTENSTDIIFRKDADGKILYISSSIRRITGYNQQQLLNHYLFEFLHEDDVPAITAVHKTVLVSPDNSVKLEFRLKHANGRLLWMEGMAVNMLGVAGVESIILNIRNITERKEAEQKLLASELRFRSLIENSHDGIALLGKEGKMVYLSSTVERILGYTAEELNGVDPQTLAHPDEIAPVLGILEELAPRFGETATAEYRMKHKNGDWRWLKANITNQLHQEGIGAFVFNYEDITERKESEEKLVNYEANLKTIFDNTEIAYTMLDKQLNMVTFNRRADLWAETFFGKQLKVGKALLAYIKNGAESARLRVLLKKVLEGKDIKFDFHMAAPDGGEMWYIARINPVTGHDGQVHGVCLAISDITLRKKHEIEMEKMTADLIQRNKDLEQFTFVVSHNLRAPLTNIMGLSQLLMDDHQTEAFKDRYANQLLQSAQKMDVIIKDLNHILQIKKEVREVRQTVYFSELVQDIKQSIQLIIIQQDVAIVTDFAEVNELLTIKSYLYSIFYNLITNSIKYRQQGKQMLIAIKSKVIANKVELEITDNGLGIDLKRKGKEVFGLYKRFHYHVEGKGMGLFMVKTQVEALGGTIKIESEVNKGTTFTISFPLS
jgi:PAS domain S-box-containing protein